MGILSFAASLSDVPVLAGGGGDDAVNALPQQDVDVVFFALQHFVGIAEHEAVAVGDQHVFNTAHDFAKEGIGDIGDDEPNDAGALGGQAARGHVRPIAERADGFTHALLGVVFDEARVVDDVGDGGFGDASLLGDIAHGDSFHAGLASSMQPVAQPID